MSHTELIFNTILFSRDPGNGISSNRILFCIAEVMSIKKTSNLELLLDWKAKQRYGTIMFTRLIAVISKIITGPDQPFPSVLKIYPYGLHDFVCICIYK